MSSKSRAAFPHSGLTALKVIAEILAVTACSHRASDLSAPEHNTHGSPLQPLGDVCALRSCCHALADSLKAL